MERRTMSTLMAAVLSLGILGGCSSGKDQSSDSTGSSSSSKSGDPVTLRVGIFDRGNSPAGVTVSNNYWTNWVQKNFGDPNNIKVEYVPIPRTDATGKLNAMMSSGDAPDIAFASTDNLLPYNYAKQGGLMDITKLVDQYGPNLKKYLGETLNYGKVDGVQYSIPGRRVNLGKYDWLIRQDWLEKLNMPMPKTTEEVYQTLKAFKEKDPGQTGGKTIPLGFSLTAASIEPLVWSFLNKSTDEQRYTLSQKIGYPILLPGHKDAVRFMNKLYNEGLMSPDFALDKDRKKLLQDVMTGKVGMYSEDLGQSFQDNPGVMKVLTQNITGANLAPVDPYTNEEGKHLKPQYVSTGFYLMIPASSKRGVEAIKYLDWMAQDDVMFTLMHGEEGKDYKMVDGLPQRIESAETTNKMYNSNDIVMITQGEDFGSKEKNLQSVAAAVPVQFRENLKKAYEMSMTDTIDYANFEKPIEAEVKYAPTLQDKYYEIIVKSVMSKKEDFDKTYDEMIKDYMESGGDAIMKERTEAYKAMKK
jgi:putative aldouronate transport system substrate-binding protein